MAIDLEATEHEYEENQDVSASSPGPLEITPYQLTQHESEDCVMGLQTDTINDYIAVRERAGATTEADNDVAAKAAPAEDEFSGTMVALGFKTKVQGWHGNPTGGRWQRAFPKYPELKADYDGLGRRQVGQSKSRADWLEKRVTSKR